MKNLMNAMFSPERIFLVDGLGVALTATMLGVQEFSLSWKS